MAWCRWHGQNHVDSRWEMTSTGPERSQSRGSRPLPVSPRSWLGPLQCCSWHFQCSLRLSVPAYACLCCIFPGYTLLDTFRLCSLAISPSPLLKQMFVWTQTWIFVQLQSSTNRVHLILCLQGRHCLLGAQLPCIDVLERANIFPIVLFLQPKSEKKLRFV